MGPDVPNGRDLTGCGCHSRFTKTSNEKLIWQPFKGKSFPQVNYFGREKKYHGWKSEASVQSARARSVPREHHYLPTDGSHKLLSVCCCLLINLTLHKNPKIWRIQHSWPFRIHIKKWWKSKLIFLFWIFPICVLSCMMFINKLLVIDRRLNKIIIIFFRPIRCLCFLVGQFTHRLWLDLCILLKPWVNSNLL